MGEAISLVGFLRRFPDEGAARGYFEHLRWKDGMYCPHCGGVRVAVVTGGKPMPYRCRDCRKHFSVRTGMVLASSRLPLHTWLLAIYMLTTARKGISSVQLAKQLGVTQKTAWFLAQRIREGFLSQRPADLSGDVEVDETYVGGKEKNKHARKKLRAGRGHVGKAIVVGAKSRGGEVVVDVVPNTDAVTLQGFIVDHVALGSRVHTDELRSYLGMPYQHGIVRHGARQYVDGQVHTNSIESVWALLKRSHYGIYHHMSHKHLLRYACETAFRHNTAKLGTLDAIDRTISGFNGRRLTYRDLVHAA